MNTKTICRWNVETVDAGESARVAAGRMRDRNVGTLVVVDGEKVPIGMVTDRDLALKIMGAGHDPETLCVHEVMTTSPLTVTEDTSIETALSTMSGHGVRRLPVVGLNGELVGMLSLDDVLTHMAATFNSIHRLLEQHTQESLAAH